MFTPSQCKENRANGATEILCAYFSGNVNAAVPSNQTPLASLVALGMTQAIQILNLQNDPVDSANDAKFCNTSFPTFHLCLRLNTFVAHAKAASLSPPLIPTTAIALGAIPRRSCQAIRKVLKA